MGTLYENIFSLCAAGNVKPSKMCVDLGLSKSLVTKLKSTPQKTITAETAQKIADYFNVSVDRVLGTEKEEEKPKFSDKGAEFINKYEKLSPEQQQIIDAMINQMYGKKDV